MVNEVVIDTSALIEYVFATLKGQAVKEFMEHRENIILIPSIVFGEFASKLERCGVSNVDDIIDDLSAYSVSLPLNHETCIEAGKKHAILRKRDKTISLIDCIIMEIAEEHGNALILTSDRHFKQYKNTKLI